MSPFPTAIQPYSPIGSTTEPFKIGSLEDNYLYLSLMKRYKEAGAESYSLVGLIDEFGATDVYVLIDNNYLSIVENARVMLSFLVPGTTANLFFDARRFGKEIPIRLPQKREQDLIAFLDNFSVRAPERVLVAC